MKKIIPPDIYRGLPCSAVAVGCAKGVAHRSEAQCLCAADLKEDGYLSLKGMNALIRANLAVLRRDNFKRGERPLLREWARNHRKQKAVVCVKGHYVYFDGDDYHSFFWNGGDEVITAWYIK